MPDDLKQVARDKFPMPDQPSDDDELAVYSAVVKDVWKKRSEWIEGERRRLAEEAAASKKRNAKASVTVIEDESDIPRLPRQGKDQAQQQYNPKDPESCAKCRESQQQCTFSVSGRGDLLKACDRCRNLKVHCDNPRNLTKPRNAKQTRKEPSAEVLDGDEGATESSAGASRDSARSAKALAEAVRVLATALDGLGEATLEAARIGYKAQVLAARMQGKNVPEDDEDDEFGPTTPEAGPSSGVRKRRTIVLNIGL